MDTDDLDAPFSQPPGARPRVTPESAPTVGLRPPAVDESAATVTDPRPPPVPPPRWGDLEASTHGPTLRESVEEIDPTHLSVPRPPARGASIPPTRTDTPALVSPPTPRPSARPSPKSSRPPPAEARAWGEVDLGGVSSDIGRPVALESQRPLAGPRDPATPPAPDTVRDEGLALADHARVVEVGALPKLREGYVYYCDTCRTYVPPEQVLAMSTSEGRVAVPVCSTCRRFVRAEPSTRTRSLDVVLLSAIGWPFTREMMATLVGHVAVFWLFSSTWVFGIAPVALVGLAAALGVLATYGAAIVRSSARGDDEPPPPSDAIASWDVASAVLRYAMVFAIGGLPLLYALYAAALGDHSPTQRTALVVAGAIVFCLYVPAGTIVASTRETFAAAVNPIAPIRFAWRLGGAYLLATAILLAFTLAHLVSIGVTMALAGAVFGPGLFSGLLAGLCVSPVVVLGVLVEARMLGLVVREHRFDLSLI